MNYLSDIGTRKIPQNQPIPGSTQVPNSAGGHAWAVDDWMRLERFLILGSEGGSYYASQRKLTLENAQAVIRCVNSDGLRAVKVITEISDAGRAPKNDPAIFALAVAASMGDDKTRKVALDALPQVCRIGTHLFTFASYVEQFRGWGRGLRKAVAAWYNDKDLDTLVYQAVKYRQRNGWTHRDLLRLAHPEAPTGEHDAVYRWIVGKDGNDVPEAIHAYVDAQSAQTPKGTASLIQSYGDKLPREAINPEHLTDPNVWDALLRTGMPMTALLRNLATMSRVGLLKPMSDATKIVVDQIGDTERLRKARVHPLAVLVAMKTYEQGYSERSGQTWDPVASIVDALDGAFYAAFGNVEPSNKTIMLALDVSGSMSFTQIANMPGITPRVGSAAMALITAATEPNYVVAGFARQFIPLNITPRQRLNDVIQTVSNLPFGGTDCALPILIAQQNNLPIETFVIYTDSETWAGNIHPSQALRAYRESTGINAKLVVVGMVSNGFSIADPNDAGMLDVVGFDTATPNVIAQFSAE